MKKTVLWFGLISGVVTVGMTLATIPLINSGDLRRSDVLGYTSIVLAALLVFFGVRSYREHAGGGRLTFGRGVAVGALITLVSSACYVASWELLYFRFMPGLGGRIAACTVERARMAGAGDREIGEALRRAQRLKAMLDDPLTNVALTLAEPLPVGLLMSAVSAAILRRK